MGSLKNNDQNRTLWLGNVEPWMDETYFAKSFAHTNALNIKVMRDKDTGLSRNYAFVEFPTHEDAKQVMDKNSPNFFTLDGSKLKLSWATQNLGSHTGYPNLTEESSLYVGNLDASVTETDLYSLFHAKFQSVTCARLIPDPDNGGNRPFAFVRFSDPSEARAAVLLLQGVHIGGRAIRIKPAQRPNGDVVGTNQLGQWLQAHESQQVDSVAVSSAASGGFLVYFCGMQPWTTEADVLGLFKGFGALYRGTAFPGTGTGVVEFMDKQIAQQAVQHLQGEMGAQAYWVDSNVSGEAPLAHQPWSSPANQEQRPPPPPPPPAVTNMTKPLAQWHLQNVQHSQCHASVAPPPPYVYQGMGAGPAWQSRVSCAAPSIEHFQQLLQDPCFVQAFEQQLAEVCQAPVAPAQTQPAAESAIDGLTVKLPWLLEDRPELFEGVLSVERMNEDYMAVCCRPGFGSPVIPNPALHGLDVEL